MTKTILLLLMMGFLFLGCLGPASPADGESVPSEETDVPDATPVGDEDEEPAETVPETEPEDESETGTEPETEPEDECEETEPTEPVHTGAEPGQTEVLLLGRSVAYYWTEYMGLEWTCDDEVCHTGSPRGNYNGYYITYYELSYPPEIALSAADAVDTYGTEADVVFFKFCFVDFVADHDLQNARANEALVEDVYQYVVVDRGKKLIIGNALPQVSAHTEPALTDNHLEFNSWLSNFAATHDDVQVLDLYGTLADSSGALKSEYAIASDDSHLTSAAYDEITPDFFVLVDNS